MGSADPAPALIDSPPPDELAAAPHSRLRRIVIPLLMIVGIQFWLIFSGLDYGRPVEWLFLAAALVAAAIPVARAAIAGALNAFRHPTPRARAWAAAGWFAVSMIALPWMGRHQQRDLHPIWKDEYSYALQIQMLAHGRLWLPEHPLHDFFDASQIIVEPVYASAYFPGASLLYVPALWLGIPFWIESAIMASACVALLYLIVTALIDGVAGSMAALMMLGVSQFRLIALMAIGHPTIILLGLLIIATWLRWRQTRSPLAVLLLGALSGWAAITRPLDALVVAVPIGVDMLIYVWRGGQGGSIAKTAALLLGGAAPFLALQLVFNVGVTGSWRNFPFDMAANRDYPGTTYGFHTYDPSVRPASSLPQKQKSFDIFAVPAIKSHQPSIVFRSWFTRDLPAALQYGLPHPLLICLLPLSVAGLASSRRRVVWVMFPLWVCLYFFYTFSLAYYVLIAVPSLIVSVLIGSRQLEIGGAAVRTAIGVFIACAIVILSVARTPPFAQGRDQWMDSSELRRIDAVLAHLDRSPAVVLFHFPPQGAAHLEPVYNITTPWPDDAEVIRAHDLGDRNVEIFRYYAQHQPGRAFYRYDRADGSLTFLGLARDLGHD
jgi:hypothetical protein